MSGEELAVAKKFKTAQTKRWTTPGMLAGNEVPNWSDNSQSMQRRIVLFDFPHTVSQGDMRLADKLAEELPLILVKSNRAYREFAGRHGQTNIWNILPDYFRTTREQMAQDVNVVEAFVASGAVRLHDDAWCPSKLLTSSLKAYAGENNFHVGKITSDFWRGPFAKFGLRETKRPETRVYRGREVKDKFVLGLDVAEEGGGGAGAGAGGAF